MSVPNQTPYNTYTANGLTTVFAYEFYLISASDIQVTINGNLVTSGYTVADVGNVQGGDITFLTPPANGSAVMLERVTPTYRLTDYQDNGDLLADTVNKDFNRIWMAIQRAFFELDFTLTRPFLGGPYNAKGYRIANLADPVDDQDAATKKFVVDNDKANLSRTLRVPEPIIEIPVAGIRKNKILAFNNSGDPITVLPESGTAADVMIELASDEDGKGDALLAVKQPFPGSVLRTQHDKNAEFVSLDDAGGDRDSFDPETLELLVKAVANQLRIPYLGAQQFALPGQTLKVWRYMDGFKDRGAVASFMSVDSPDSSEPTTQVLGLSDASALGKYSDRDTVVLFAQAEGQPPLLATSNTTFTATTVTSPDFAAVADKLRRKQIIDVVDASTPSKIYSGWIVAFDPDTNTITIETTWYLKGGNGITTGTPSSGSSLKLVPNTKIWGQNTNVILKPTSDARDFAGFELGLYNNKTNSPVGYGYDAYSGGTYTVLNGFQARGKLYCGFRNYAQGDYGYIGGGHQYGYYDSGSERGLFAWNNTYGVNIKSPTSYAIILQDSSNAFITGMDKDGKWQGLKYYTTTVSPGGSISQYSTVAFVTPTAASQTVTLPAHSAGKVIYVRNLSSSYSISCVGAMEGASGAIALAAKTTIQLVSDGTYWYPISKYVP
ncbi:hypothetical protein JJ672_09275 [Klebsiella pneumoniae]|nr:hypothetical protein JJ672_09275 [Klebsiella pneumoniae]